MRFNPMQYLKFKSILLSAIAVTSVVFSSCVDNFRQSSTNRMWGYKPIYSSDGNVASLIKSGPAQSLTNTGKIYTKGNLLFVVRPTEGVHVFDNTDPKNPINLNFISIPGNLDVAMKGNTLYADFLGDIAVIDISNIANPITKQTAKTMSAEFKYHPPSSGNNSWSRIYFECVDDSKGVVVGWQYVELNNPKCYQ